VIDRMDEALEFPLPSSSERRQIIQLYLDLYISKAGTAEGGAGAGAAVSLADRLQALLRGRKLAADRIRVEGIADSHIDEAAARTEVQGASAHGGLRGR
jgi:ATPase family AAA domain-containing protein 3A/B